MLYGDACARRSMQGGSGAAATGGPPHGGGAKIAPQSFVAAHGPKAVGSCGGGATKPYRHRLGRKYDCGRGQSGVGLVEHLSHSSAGAGKTSDSVFGFASGVCPAFATRRWVGNSATRGDHTVDGAHSVDGYVPASSPCDVAANSASTTNASQAGVWPSCNRCCRSALIRMR